MNRPLKALALAAFALAAALGATATQASANNFTVNFKFKNADPLLSMIRTSSLPSTVTGLINPPASIASLAFDPNSGNATYSDLLPGLGSSKHVDITYAQSDGVSNLCTFTITVSRDNNVQPYLLQFSKTANTNCVVPTGTSRSSNGVFTGTFELDWST